MDSESSAYGASNNKHHRYMVFGKKQRYIEVFQCSGEDMSVVLTGGVSGASAGKPQPPLLSPGMLPSPAPLVSGQVGQYDMLSLGALGVQPGLTAGLAGVPQLLPTAASRPDLNMLQLLQVQGLGLGLPPTTPPLVMLPPRPGLAIQPTALQLQGLQPQQRFPGLLPSPQTGLFPHIPATGGKRTHEQAFTAAGGYTGTLPPKRPPVMYTTTQAGVVTTPTPPGTPALLPTPTTLYGTQATPPVSHVAAAYPTL